MLTDLLRYSLIALRELRLVSSGVVGRTERNSSHWNSTTDDIGKKVRRVQVEQQQPFAPDSTADLCTGIKPEIISQAI